MSDVRFQPAQTSTAAFAQDTTPTTGNQNPAQASGYKPASTVDVDNTSWSLTHWTNPDGAPHPVFTENLSAAKPITLDLKMTDGGKLRASGFDGSNTYSGTAAVPDGKAHMPDRFTGSAMIDVTSTPREYADDLTHVTRTEVRPADPQAGDPQQLRLTVANGEKLEFNRQ